MGNSRAKFNWTRIAEISSVVGVIIAIIGTIVAFVALKVSIDTQNDARNIAIESGSLDKPNLKVFLGKLELSRNTVNNLFLGFPINNEKDVNLAQMNFIILNDGKKSAQNVEIIDEVPKFSRPPLFKEVMKLEVESPSQTKKDDLKHSITEIGNFNYFFYGVSSVKPQEAMRFPSPFLIDETEITDTFDVKGGKVDVKLTYSIQHNISVSYEDSPKISYPFQVSVFNSKNNDELIRHVAGYMDKDLGKQRKTLSFPSSWFQTLKSKSFIAFANPIQKSEVDGVKLNEIKFDENTILEMEAIDKPIPLLIILYGLTILIIFFLLIFSLYIFRKRKRTKRNKKSSTSSKVAN